LKTANCPVTEGSGAFSPTAPDDETAPPATFWYGNTGLWTNLQVDGTLRGLNQNAIGLRQKVFWWHPGFDGKSEQKPELTVTGRRLDSAGSFVQSPPATNAFDGWAILGLIFPLSGAGSSPVGTEVILFRSSSQSSHYGCSPTSRWSRQRCCDRERCGPARAVTPSPATLVSRWATTRNRSNRQ
jgi:hypothetical protein